MSRRLVAGQLFVESRVGVSKDRKRAKGLVVLTVDDDAAVVNMDLDSADRFLTNLTDGIAGARRDEVFAQGWLDKGVPVEEFGTRLRKIGEEQGTIDEPPVPWCIVVYGAPTQGDEPPSPVTVIGPFVDKESATSHMVSHHAGDVAEARPMNPPIQQETTPA